MESISKLISTALAMGLALASVGKLPQATQWLAEQAARAQPQQVNLGKLNRALVGTGHTLKRHKETASIGGR